MIGVSLSDDLSELTAKLAKASKPTRAESGPEQRGMGDAMQLAIDLVLAVGAGLAIGLFLDSKLGTKPWLTLVFLIIGVAAGFRNFYLFARKLMQPNQDTKD